ncbi:MAG: pilus assembly protein [Myxococcales bacterium]|nr:pilus assembly protein [Myxococcales bacterium]
MQRLSNGERGSAMVEAAIIFPCLVLILYWSAALTDVMVLKLKAAEALRYSLWEMTVFKPPAQINTEVQQRFVDLRSPKRINISYTGLLMYPLARDMAWKANVDTTTNHGGLGGNKIPPQGNGFLDRLLTLVQNALATAVDANLKLWKFNLNGEATATVTLVRARHDEEASPILKGGDLLGLKGGNDLDHPPSMTNLTFKAPLPSQRPMRLVFDTWKAWPKPKAYTLDGAPTDVNTSPTRTYPVVEEQVARQVDKIAFFGLDNVPFFGSVRTIYNSIMRGPVTEYIVGGRLPDVISSERMDGPQRGPITILPPDRDNSDPSWVPNRCEIKGSTVNCPTHRLGDETGRGTSAIKIDNNNSMGDQVDRSRYTIPYRINTEYWTQSGGTVKNAEGRKLKSVAANIARNNEYVKSWQCRGHYFLASTKPQETDVGKRYKQACER